MSRIGFSFRKVSSRRPSFLANFVRTISTIDLTQPCQPLNYIDGKRVYPCSEENDGDIYVLEPATGKILCETKGSGKLEVDRATFAAREAFATWSKMSGLERGKILREAARIVRSRVKDLATVEVTDNGN